MRSKEGEQSIKIGENKNIFGQLLYKIRAFSGKNNVNLGILLIFRVNIIKCGYCDNFSGKNHVKFGRFLNFSLGPTYFFRQKCLP